MEQSKKHITDESSLRRKIMQVHAHEYDGGAAVASFDTDSLLVTVEAILHTTNNPHEADKLHEIISRDTTMLDTQTLPYLLHKITCVLNCECGRDSHDATALEILQLLKNYSWEAKIAVVLASFILDYAQFHLLAAVSAAANPLAAVVATLKQIPDVHMISTDEHIRSKFLTIGKLLNVSIQVSRLIAAFGCLPSKHISTDAEPVAIASDQIPLAVYWITRLVIVCASEFTGILGFAETKSSYTETWNITSLEEKITTIHTNFNGQLRLCNLYIEKKKHTKYVEKLKGMFSQKIVHVDNQKILHTLFVKKKDGSVRPLSCGPDVSIEYGVEALKGKTVLLLISNLEISVEEITKLKEIYQESRTKKELQLHYEIVWLPIVEKSESESEETIAQKFEEVKNNMPWHTLVRHSLLKRGVARYAKEEWKYSNKTMMVALDQRGKVVNPNAFHMVSTWGNEFYPFTQRHELSLWSRKTWSLELLIDKTSHHKDVSSWMNDENKVICLYGGEKHEWIEDFVKTTRKIGTEANISLEMVYVGKNTSTEVITEVKKIVTESGSICWDTNVSAHFWRRIESMMYSKVHHGAKVTMAKKAGDGDGDGDAILRELLYMLTLGDCDQGWALISQGKGIGKGKIARAKGDVIMTALTEEFNTWSEKIEEKKSFVVALHDYLAGRPATAHHCNRLILPGMDDIPEILVCAECYKPMEKFIMYRCCT